MEDTKFKMFCDYIDELQDIKKVPRLNRWQLEKLYLEYINTECSDWIDIFSDNGKLIGFAIIGYYPNCHPDAEVYITEAYIIPEYRRQGYMHKTITQYIKNNHGTYCLFIVKNNDIALQFWQKVFADNGYKQIELADIGAADDYCIQYGFAEVNRERI